MHSSNPLVVELMPDMLEGGYTARVPDIPAYGEGETADLAINDLREGLRGYIETFGLDDAVSRVVTFSIQTVDWNLEDLAHG
jgi:predicted RNase H-like HicB family nuclease